MSTTKSMLTGIENAASYLSSPTIRIHVGEEDARTFFVHKDLLTSRSPFFAKALKGYRDRAEPNFANTSAEVIQWKEGEEGAIELPDDDPAIFEAYIQLLYYNQIPIRSSTQAPSFSADLSPEELVDVQNHFWIEERCKIDGDYLMISKLYVFAEKIRDVTAKQALLHAFVEAISTPRFRGVRRYPEAAPITTVYEGTLEGDPMRAFLTDCYVLVGCAGWAGTSSAALPREFLFDVVVGLYATRPRPSDFSKLQDASVYIEKLKPEGE